MQQNILLPLAAVAAILMSHAEKVYNYANMEHKAINKAIVKTDAKIQQIIIPKADYRHQHSTTA